MAGGSGGRADTQWPLCHLIRVRAPAHTGHSSDHQSSSRADPDPVVFGCLIQACKAATDILRFISMLLPWLSGVIIFEYLNQCYCAGWFIVIMKKLVILSLLLLIDRHSFLK